LPDALVLPPLTTSAPDEPATDAARAAGFAAGYAAGARRAAVDAAAQAAAVAQQVAADAQAVRAAHSRALAVLAAATDAVRGLTAPVLASVTASVHAAGLELAQAVLGVELADHERSARAALVRVLAAEPGAGPVRVHLHPADLAALGPDATPAGLELVGDASLAPGDAVAHLADGQLDARVASALDRARAALTQVTSDDAATADALTGAGPTATELTGTELTGTEQEPTR